MIKIISKWQEKIGATIEHKITINPLGKGTFLTANGELFSVNEVPIIAAFLITLQFHTISEDF